MTGFTAPYRTASRRDTASQTMLTCTLVLAIPICFPLNVAAQTRTLADLQKFVDIDVLVQNPAGEERRVRLRGATAAGLEIADGGQTATIPAPEIVRVRRPGNDPVGDGALKGALIGATAAGVPCLAANTKVRLCALVIPASAAVYGGLGALVDFLRKGPDVIYRRR